MKKEYALKALGMDLNAVAARVSEVLSIKAKDVWAKGRYKRIVEARSLLCYWASRELGVSMSSLAKKLGISLPSMSDSVKSGQIIAEEKGFSLINS
jgi:putative transposase